MINPIKQNFVASANVTSKGQNKESKEIKENNETTEAGKIDTKVENIKAAIASGNYKIDMKAAAKAFAEALL